MQVHTNGDGLQHGLEVGDVVQDARHKAIQGSAVPQQLLGRLHMLLLQPHVHILQSLSYNATDLCTVQNSLC